MKSIAAFSAGTWNSGTHNNSKKRTGSRISGSPDNENTNEEEENSFVANSLLMLQQAQNNSISTTQANRKSPEDELDIELFKFPVIWKIRLTGFKNYNKKVAWNNISSSLDNKYSAEPMFSLANAMLFNYRYIS